MSLEKFQATDAWRNKFKTHLFAERKPPSAASTSVPIPQNPQRLSYQLSEDLQVILEEKKIPRPNSNNSNNMPRVRVRDAEEDDKENITEFHKRIHASAASITPSKLKRQTAVDMTVMEDLENDPLHITNTSFETLENMCEKTASDPNSTLFKYLRTGSPTTTSSTHCNVRIPTYDEEADALERLLDELNVEETKKKIKSIPTLCDDTQLDDIEAPSRFWDNTMTAETLQSISPVKMVGLMRQSTIMEEFSDVSESETSSASYFSAMKTGCSSETTECYETANDTAACSERGILKKISTNSSQRSTSSELFLQRSSRQKFFNDATTESQEKDDEGDEIEEHIEKSIHLMDFSLQNNEQQDQDPLGESIQLIDLDTTVKSPPEDESENDESSVDAFKSSPQLIQSDESESFVIELSDDESSSSPPETQKTKNVLNRSFTIKDEQPQQIDEEKSLHFNDTMEEVEYMMNKGMQYMQAAKESQEQPSFASSTNNKSIKSHLTPVKKFDRYRSPSPMLSSAAASTFSPKTIIAKPKPINKHALDIKPFPKLDLFKKPQLSSASKPLNKLTSSVKKQQQQYAHVVSPIGAYIKKTPTTPLISTVRPEVAGISSSAMCSSKALRKLDCDSVFGSPRQMKSPNVVRSLPKKAYISSELKHIVDERTKVTIPGGPKIQRYLASAMIPAVVRHEGKVKIPANLRTSELVSSAPSRRTDDSLADLSLVSGDVSVYTIKDAQKF